MSSLTAGKIVVFLLRFLGINAVLALVFLMMPFSWIKEIHIWLGLGEMPTAPIVGYLTRSLCLFYAILGVILLVVSFDVEHYHSLLRVFGLLFPIIGIVILGIDIHEKLPLTWILSEGPFMIVFGLLFLRLLKAMERGN